MTSSGSGPPPTEIVPVRHPGRWLASAALLVLAVMLVHTLFFSYTVRGGRRQPRFEWHIIDHYFFSGFILKGLLVTLELTVIAMIGGIVLGAVLAVMRLSPNPIVSTTSWMYIWFFRGTPVLVQVLFWYYAAYLYPKFTIGVPFGPALLHINLNKTLTPLVAASFALALNEGAYMSEIVRAGILAVDEGQTEAAQSIGMSRLMTLRLIILPQAMRVIIPPTGNETISMLKTSSIASVITVGEILYRVQSIYAVNFQTVPLLVVASLWYLIVTSVLMVGQFYLERYFARGTSRQPPEPMMRRLAGSLRIRGQKPLPVEHPVVGGIGHG